MFKRQRSVHTVRTRPRSIGRRALITSSLTGGAALAATILPGVTGSAQGQQRQATQSASQLWTTGHIRRVLTGRNSEGKSIVVSDEPVAINDIWKTTPDQPLGSPPAGEPKGVLPTTAPQVDPVRGGTRFFIAAIPPSGPTKPTLANRQGFHRTATVDYIFILSGEITLLTDVREVKLHAGDCTVLRNIYHSWRNDGDAPCHLLVGMVQAGG